MATAVALLEHEALESRPAPWSRTEVVARYTRLREISKRLHHEMLDVISGDAILAHARRLGLAHGRTLILDDVDEMNYAFDLAIHTAPANRSRAIDRYAKSARFAPESDERLVLDAMRTARFAILHVERRHEVAGLVAADVFRRADVWLMDTGLEGTLSEGAIMATRLYSPERFSMTAGVVVPFEPEMIPDLADGLPRHLRGMPLDDMIDDRRFAEAIYRIALADGVMDRVTYQDPPVEVNWTAASSARPPTDH